MELNEIKIIESNKMIAMFMGNKLKGELYINQFHNFPIEYSCLSAELKYHASWDWLMPVVIKIHDEWFEKLESLGKHEIFELGLATPINDIWKAVVEFIEWHNAQKHLI